jgi:hypothetical protein
MEVLSSLRTPQFYRTVAIIFLISGLEYSAPGFLERALNWRSHVVVQVTAFLLLPAPVAAVVHSTLAGDPNVSRQQLPQMFELREVTARRSCSGDVLIANILRPFGMLGWIATLLLNAPEFEPFQQLKGRW